MLESAAPDLTCRVSMPVTGMHTVLSEPNGQVDDCHCGPCKDIPLTLASPDAIISAIPIQGKVANTHPPATTISRFTLLSLLSATPEKLVQGSSARHFPLVSLRTVILLI